MDDKSTRGKIAALLDSKKFGALCTVGEDGPYVSLVAFAADNELKFLLFATPAATRKYRNILARPRVAMLVENSKNLASDFEEAMAVTILGDVVAPSAVEIKELADLFLSRHPALKSFIGSSDNVLMKMVIDELVLVDSFQNVTKVRNEK